MSASPKGNEGFTLMEMLILVALIGVVASVAIPSMVQQRISSNEAATIGDIRTVISAQAAYQSANGGYYEGAITCLSQQGGCVPDSNATSPSYLDASLATLQPRFGYMRYLVPGISPANDPQVGVTLSATSKVAYSYLATPIQQGVTGVRGFGGDATGILCFTPGGSPPGVDAEAKLDLTTCTILK